MPVLPVQLRVLTEDLRLGCVLGERRVVFAQLGGAGVDNLPRRGVVGTLLHDDLAVPPGRIRLVVAMHAHVSAPVELPGAGLHRGIRKARRPLLLDDVAQAVEFLFTDDLPPGEIEQLVDQTGPGMIQGNIGNDNSLTMSH